MTNKRVTVVGYITYAIITFVVLWFAVKLQRNVSLYSMTHFTYYPFVIYTVVCSYVLGVYFSLPHLMKELFWKEGNWSFNSVKFLCWSFPLILLSIVPLLTFRNANALELVLTHSKLLIYYEMNVLLIGILAFYTLLTSFTRKQEPLL